MTASHINLDDIQHHLQTYDLDGWLLYDFRGQNPIALHVAGLSSGGSRRWFLWIPRTGEPHWLIHAIEAATFTHIPSALRGETTYYVSWRELEDALTHMVTGTRDGSLRIAMEYSPDCAVPYVSKVDAGTKELVERATGATIVSSADLVQHVQAVLTPVQLTSHRRAAAACLAAKDAAFDFIRTELAAGRPLTEYDVQQQIMEHLSVSGMRLEHAPIVSVNRFAAIPHYAPDAERHNPIREGDMVLMDIFGRSADSPSDCVADITWTAYCGRQTPDAVRIVFDAVAAGRDAAVEFMQKRLSAGEPVHGYEVDEVCRTTIEQAGYGNFILHRTGHSLGTAVHFNGVNIDNLETQDRRRLIPGVMFTIEPGIYMPDFNFDGGPHAKGLGIRSEINCYVHEDRVEVTTLPLQTEVPALLA